MNYKINLFKLPLLSHNFSNSLKSISNNFNLKNVVNKTVKASSQLQKMQSQNEIASAKAQSAMAKAAFDTENYAFKSEKLAKVREKLSEAERKVATNAKWDEEAKNSLDAALKTAIDNMKVEQTALSNSNNISKS